MIRGCVREKGVSEDGWKRMCERRVWVCQRMRRASYLCTLLTALAR